MEWGFAYILSAHGERLAKKRQAAEVSPLRRAMKRVLKRVAAIVVRRHRRTPGFSARRSEIRNKEGG